jgi:hypothetical protein
MPEHPDLRILGRLATAQQRQPAKDPDHDQIKEAKRHKPRSCPNMVIRPNHRSQPPRRVLKRYTYHRVTAVGTFAAATRPGERVVRGRIREGHLHHLRRFGGLAPPVPWLVPSAQAGRGGIPVAAFARTAVLDATGS